ncbi:MAG: hypothetical protein B7733_09985 [Myxococcales bacterium FL481]|nr:MAG: hypothetical protein B7733_09985 [Myxococcales bacterium FL481]
MSAPAERTLRVDPFHTWWQRRARVITLRNDPTDVRAVFRFVRWLPNAQVAVEPADHAAVDRGIAGPSIRDHDQLGELREYTSPWGRIEVSSRGNVIRMRSSLEPKGPAHVDLGRAGEVAADFVEAVVEDAATRNFEAEASGHAGDLYEFRWVERPRPGQHAIFPNDVTVRVFPQTGEVATFFATDVRSYRTTPPLVDRARLLRLVAELLEGHPHEVRRSVLVEDSINGGMDTRTVYRVDLVMTADGRVLNVVLDADSGACLNAPRMQRLHPRAAASSRSTSEPA